MSHCINPSCAQPQNLDDQEQCQSCGSRLILDEELLYRALQPLMLKQDTQLYEVADTQGKKAVLKVLSTNSTRLVQLFERETEILQRLTHPGIPEFKRAFTFETQNGTSLRCLVMEHIEGQNLEQWLSTHLLLEESLALKWLKQLVEILYVVHRSGFLHQDIKPANILCKPNQQLALVDFSNLPGIVSAGFSPSEQADGHAIPSSDFFALGRTFSYLLTGKHPLNLPKDPQTQRLIWQNQAQITEPFAALVDDLMAPLPHQRPQDAQAILTKIDEIQEKQRTLREAVSTSPPPGFNPDFLQPKHKWRKRLAWSMGGAGWVLAVLFALPQIQKWHSGIWLTPDPVCNIRLQDSISCGEESFLPDHSKNSKVPKQKQQGTDAFAAGDYSSAVKLLTQARLQDPGDPETLIYLNNARLATGQKEAYTIAIVAPLSNRRSLSLEALRGVAQVQDSINDKNLINGKHLRVLLADDANTEEQAKEVAAELVKRKDVLGVLGHYASEMTLAAVPIYQRHSLVLVSYGSTSTDLSGYGFLENHVFFRTVPTTQVSAISLASYLKGQSAHQNVAVFYNPNSPYSRSLRDWFELSINALEGSIFDRIQNKETFNLCQDPFDAGRYLNYVQTQKATAIAIFPDGKVCESSYPNSFDIIPRQNSSLPIIGSWLFMSDLDSTNVTPDKLERFVGAAPWNRFSPQAQNSSFLQQADALWNKPNTFADDKVSALTAASYDAARSLVSAFLKLTPQDQDQPQRMDVQKILAAENFQVEGATGPLRFVGGDRREPINTLFKVVPSKSCNSRGYSIVPLAYVKGSNVLDCSKFKHPS